MKIKAALLCLLLAGCATTEKYEAKLNSWVGADMNALVNSWGYPSSSFSAPDGNTVYVYDSRGSYTTPTSYQTTYQANTLTGGVDATTVQRGGQTFNYWCTTYFEVDAEKKIVSWRWS